MFGWEVISRIGIGDLGISPHGVGIAIGVYVGALVMAGRARRQGLDENHTWNGAAWGVVGAIIGARVAYVVGHLDQFDTFLDYFKIWQGGISLVGGLLGAFLFVYVYTRKQGFSYFQLMDLGAPGLGIGIAVGRIGDLLIGDHLGKETSGPWGWQYQGGELISPPPCLTPGGERVYSTIDGCIEPGVIVHQTALYDMIWSLAIFGIILWLANKPRERGFLFLSWAGLYAVGRIATDFLRVDKTWFGLELTGSQITSIVALTIVLILLARYRGVPDDAPSIPSAAPTTPPPATGEEEPPADLPFTPVTPDDAPDRPEPSYPKPPPPPPVTDPPDDN